MKRVENSSRFNEVVKVFENYGFGQYFKGERRTSESLKENPEKRLKKALEHIGGGFLLAGIFLSKRVDLMPPEYCKELSRIKDRSLPVSFDHIEKTIIDEFHNRPIRTVFDKMWEKSSDSDTLTQVHKARLVNGENVFVKVIKEKAVEEVEEDIVIAKYLSEQTDNAQIKKIIKEFEEHFEKKKTLKAEKTFLENSAKAYGSNYLPTIKEPLCKDKVIVFDFEENKTKRYNKYSAVQQDIKTMKGEILFLIIGILITIITISIEGSINNIEGVIGLAMIIISLLVSIQSKLRR